MKKILLLVAAVAIVFSSCTVEKRQYMDGYHVEWLGKGKKAEAAKKQESALKENVAVAPTSTPVQEEVALVSETATNEVVAPVLESPAVPTIVERKAIREAAKQMKSEARHYAREHKADKNFSGATNFNNGAMDVANEPDTVLLVILAFLIPPLAVYLYEGEWTKRCTVNLILTLLCGVPGLIHALVIILGNK